MKALIFSDGSEGKRERSVLERVYNKTNGILFGYAMSILKDQGLAEDAVQESFLRLSKNLDKIDSPESKRTINYMITIVKNLCYTLCNRRARGPVIQLEENDTDTETDTDSVEDIVIHKEDYIWLKEAITSLDDTLREPLILYYFNEMKDNEIADLLGISRANVGVRIFRAKKKIKEYIERRETGTNG